ncbi:MAG TPA: hypothetical protein VGK01_17245, partial [Candidatus Angelobacter sp.]
RHTVRIQVDAEGQIHDHDTAIPGYFRAYSQKTLMVDFASRNLALRWGLRSTKSSVEAKRAR